jgi:hypothetical protein
VTPQAQVDGQQPVFAATVASVAPFPSSDLIDRVSTKWLAQGGIPAGDRSAYDQTAFLVKLAEKFIPINLDYPGLRILNFDPAMFTVEGFMTPEECESWQQHAEASGDAADAAAGGDAASSVTGFPQTTTTAIYSAVLAAACSALWSRCTAQHALLLMIM